MNQLMPEPHRGLHDQYIRRYMKTGVARIIGIGRESTAVTKSGRIFPVELAVAEMNMNGQRLFAGMLRDMTTRKRAEKADAKSLFVANMVRSLSFLWLL